MKDYFSSHAAVYAQFRPVYPKALYDFLLPLVAEKRVAWDCGCGNGQVASVLSEHFEHVEATDMSRKQIHHAIAKPNVEYHVCAAEHTPIESNFVNLITVAQALHWFDMEAFFGEVQRVSAPNAIIAIWCYSLMEINPQIDGVIHRLYSDTLGEQYWDPARKYIDEHYKTVPFPFEEIEAPEFSINVSWTLPQLLGYLSSWSAVQHYIQKNDTNPVDLYVEELEQVCGGLVTIDIRFPLYLRIGKVKSDS
jgi:SAM-dependent methyltransferase